MLKSIRSARLVITKDTILFISPFTGNGFGGGHKWCRDAFIRLLPDLINFKLIAFLIFAITFVIGYNL